MEASWCRGRYGYRQPGLYLATAEGLRACGLKRLGVYRVGPGGFQDACKVATVAVAWPMTIPSCIDSSTTESVTIEKAAFNRQ